jgi:hypothetical protein
LSAEQCFHEFGILDERQIKNVFVGMDGAPVQILMNL